MELLFDQPMNQVIYQTNDNNYTKFHFLNNYLLFNYSVSLKLFLNKLENR